MRRVDTHRLRQLINGSTGSISAAARRIAGADDEGRGRRMLQRVLKRGTMRQATAEEIAAGLGCDAEEFLKPLERPDPRVLELRRLGRKADRLREQLGWASRQFEDELAAPDG